MAALLEDDVWVSQKNSMLALLTEPTALDDDTWIDADGEEGTHGARKIVVDWNVVELNEKTDFFITPISDIDMPEMFGIQVDDKDKEKDDNSLPADGNIGPRNANEYEEELMRMAAHDVDDTNDNELVCLYDEENPCIEVGKLWPSMVEFRMSYRTYAVKKEFEAKTMWTDRKKFYARCKGYDGGGSACKWYISARLQPDGKNITPILAKTLNSTAKRLKVDLEKMYPIQLQYTTVWKAKQMAMKSLYGDWANTFRMLYSFKAETKKRSSGSVVEIDREWPEVEIEFTLCPLVTRRKAGRPKQSRFHAWFENGGWSRKGKMEKEKEKNENPKRAQQGNKIGASCVRRKRAVKGPPLVVEQCWPVKKARLNGFRRKRTITSETVTAEHELTETVSAEHEQIETVNVEHELTETVTVSFLQALGQSETVADEAAILLPCVEVVPCLEVVLPSVELQTETVIESALTAVLPCLEVVLPSVELQTEEVEQCVPSTQSAEVQTEEVGHCQVHKLRGPSGVVGKNSKCISINKLCAVEPNSGKKEKKSSGRKKEKK
ncbi:hypothetical protein D1007_40416 [Hordeum vulgare]|nr:hypothetical protein D1007_40416 [Hordeum vulgare]